MELRRTPAEPADVQGSAAEEPVPATSPIRATARRPSQEQVAGPSTPGLASGSGVMPGNPKHKEGVFVLPVVSADNMGGAVVIALKAVGYGGFMTLVPGAAAALLPPANLQPQYISAAIQGGLATVAAVAVAIPEIQRFTEDKWVIIPNADKRWGIPLSTFADDDPLKVAIVAGMEQKYKLAARQVGAFGCTIGAGCFIGGPPLHWGTVLGGLAIGLIGVSLFGELAQRKIWKDAVKNHQGILELSSMDPPADVDVRARKAIDEVERLSKRTTILPDLGSAVFIMLAVAGGFVGCLVAARIIGGGSHDSPDSELKELQKHIKLAVPFIIGGITQIVMLPAEYKTTAISNIKMRAALAGMEIEDRT